MRAVAVFPATREVRLVDHPEPRLATPADVRVRMLEVGVCGTDKDICDFRLGTAPPGSDYFVLGHESLGQVTEVGSGVRRLKPGDLVVAMVRLPCPHASCDPCRSQRQDQCTTGNYRERGIKDYHGFLTEFIVEDERYLHPVPARLRDVAVLVEPLTIAEKVRLHRVPVRELPGHAVVLGAGPVGLLGAMMFVHHGWDVTVYSRSPAPNPKAEIAQAIGAAYLAPPAKIDRPIDLVYEAAGAPQAAFDLLLQLAANGAFVFTGVPAPGSMRALDLRALVLNLILKNQSVLGTVNAGRDAFAAAIQDLAAFASRWPQALRGLITGRYPMEQFREPVTGRAGGIKNLIAIAAQ